MAIYTRKTLAEKLGIGIETLRYYEKIELIPLPERMENGYRVYTEEDAGLIDHIIKGKKFGFTLEEIKAIFKRFNKDNYNMDDLIKIFNEKICDIENRISELKKLKTLLKKGIASFQD